MTEECLPVVWVTSDRKRRLVRGTPTGLLVWIVRGCIRNHKQMRIFLDYGNTEATMRALIRELRDRIAEGRAFDRADPGYIVGLMNGYDPQPCACGGPGLYIQRGRTFCAACKPLAVSATRRNAVRVASLLGEKEAEADAEDRRRREAERHRRAMGRRRSNPGSRA